MAITLGTVSRSRLVGVHPHLIAVIELAASRSDIDFMVLEGVRSDEQAYANYGKGRGPAELKAKGVPIKYAMPHLAKVTWLNDPLATKHRKQKDGFGHAVDLVPWPVDWNTIAKFDRIAHFVLEAAQSLGYGVRWGYDWDQDGRPREKGESDGPHFELT